MNSQGTTVDARRDNIEEQIIHSIDPFVPPNAPTWTRHLIHFAYATTLITLIATYIGLAAYGVTSNIQAFGTVWLNMIWLVPPSIFLLHLAQKERAWMIVPALVWTVPLILQANLIGDLTYQIYSCVMLVVSAVLQILTLYRATFDIKASWMYAFCMQFEDPRMQSAMQIGLAIVFLLYHCAPLAHAILCFNTAFFDSIMLISFAVSYLLDRASQSTTYGWLTINVILMIWRAVAYPDIALILSVTYKVYVSLACVETLVLLLPCVRQWIPAWRVM